MKSRSKLRLVGCIGLAIGLCAGLQSHVHAAGGDRAYHKAVEQAVREFDRGNFAEARALFRKAHTISPSARTWRGMGMTAFELKLYVDALHELRAALDSKRRPLTATQRTQVQSLLGQARAFVGRFKLALSPPRAEVSVDHQPATLAADDTLLLDLGDHEVSAVAPGYKDMSIPVHVDGGEDVVLQLELARARGDDALGGAPMPTQPPAPVGKATSAPHVASEAPAPDHAPGAATTPASAGGIGAVPFIVLGAAALLGGASATAWLIGNKQYDSLQRSCGGACSEAQLAPLKRSDVLTNVFLGAAALSAGTALLLFVMEGSRGEAPPPTGLRAGVGDLSLRGRF